MKAKNILAAVGIAVAAMFTSPQAMADQPEKATVVFTVQPEMHCQNCENKIKTNLRFEKGVSNITTDLKGKTITIVYDTRKTDPEKLTSAFAKIGYKATKVEPNKDK